MTILLTIALSLLSSFASAEEFYLARTVGAGTDGSPYRSGCAAGASAIDLRSATGKDLWVCRSASLTGSSGAVPLAKTATERLNAQSKIDTGAAIGRPVRAGSDTVQDLLKELLVDTGKIRPGRNGKYEIYLGDPQPIWQATQVSYDLFKLEDNGILADLYLDYVDPVAAWANTFATETFTGSNGDLITFVLSWTESGAAGFSVVSNQVTTTTNTASTAYVSTPLDTDDQEVSADLITISHTGGGFSRCGVMARRDTSSQTYYSFFADSSVTGFELQKRVANTPTTLGTNIQDPVNGADRLLIRVDGSSVSGYVDGVLLIGPITDTDIVGFFYAGIYGHASTTTFTCTLDNVLLRDYSLIERKRGGAIFYN